MNFENDLKKAGSIYEIFQACNKHYITEKPLNFVQLTVVKAGIKAAIDTIKPVKR